MRSAMEWNGMERNECVACFAHHRLTSYWSRPAFFQNEFDLYLTGADGQAYSSMFVEFSAAKGTVQDYYDNALVEIKKMSKCLEAMEKELPPLQ